MPRASDNRSQWKTIEDMRESGYGVMLPSAVKLGRMPTPMGNANPGGKLLKLADWVEIKEGRSPRYYGLSTGGRRTLPMFPMLCSKDADFGRYTEEERKEEGYQVMLCNKVKKRVPMPTASLAKSGKMPVTSQDDTVRALREVYPDMIGGELNPDWVEWLMGWPIGWTALEPLEMARFRSWLRQHSSCFRGGLGSSFIDQ